MQRVHLTNLDELALSVRDRVAQSYILEAITVYRGGAYRASIVSARVAWWEGEGEGCGLGGADC